MSPIEYGGGLRRTTMSARRGGGRFRKWVDPPTSRLSNRTTKSAPGQTCAQLVRPGDHLRRQPPDQHDRRRARVPERLIRKLDVIRGNPAQRASSDITNGRSLACDKPSGHIRRSPAGLPAAGLGP
jgi:hypothetical protein